MDETFLKVMLAAQIKFGNETSRSLPFEFMLTDWVTLAIWVLKVFNRLLLSIWRTETVSKLIPSRVLKKVLEMVTLVALLTVPGKVSCDKAGRACHAMVWTDSSALMERVERRVRLVNVKAPPIEPMVVLPKLVRPPLFSHLTPPVTCCGPSMLIIPEAEELTRMLPAMVEQEAKAVASAWELMVAVDWEHMEAVDWP